MHQHVRYTGPKLPGLNPGDTALMDVHTGKVQLDGPKDMWRASSYANPFCFGWHDLGQPMQWEPVTENPKRGEI